MDSAKHPMRAALAAGYGNQSFLTEDFNHSTAMGSSEKTSYGGSVTATTVLLSEEYDDPRHHTYPPPPPPPVDPASHEPQGLYRLYDRYFNGWRAGLVRSALVSTTAWLLNIAVYIYLFTRFGSTRGQGTVMESDCTTVHRVDTGVHAVLNVVSTLVLGASVYAMEGLCSPTRAEVDRAHRRRRCVEIGVQSVGNLRWISWERVGLWLLLGVTSLPLHLFFNAVFYSSSQSNQYAVAVVGSDFLTNETWTPTPENTAPSLFRSLGGSLNEGLFERQDPTAIPDLLRDARIDAGRESFVRLDPSECISSYSQGFVEGYSDVVVVAQNQADSMLLWSRYPERSISLDKSLTNRDPFHWVCHDYLGSGLPDSEEDRCNLAMAEHLIENGNWTVYGNPVQYCLSRPSPNICRLQFSAFLMAAVLVFGFIKSIIIVYLIFRRYKGQFLRTLGDAVSSYLQQEDDTTAGMCLVSSSDFSKRKWHEGYEPRVFTGKPQRWWTSASRTQFCIATSLAFIYVILLSVSLGEAIKGSHGTAYDSGFGAPNVQSLASFIRDDTTTDGIVPNLLVANIPQLGFSILYIVFHDVYAKMLIGQELDRFSRTKKGLRVSERPRGAQRSTRFLTIPARYALPLLVGSALLHWLASRSLFLVRIDGVDSARVVDGDDQIVRLGYNVRGIIGMVATTALVVVVTVVVGAVKRVDVARGEASNSAVISAACHPERREAGAQLREVWWGDVSVDDDDGARGGGTTRHCAFTSGHAIRPVVGQLYA